MAKTIEYKSLLERDLAERALHEVLLRLISILEEQHPGLYEDGVNRLFSAKDGEPHALSYTKPN